MKRYYILMLFVLQTLILAIAQERKFYAGHLFLESKWKDCKDGKYGLSIVQLDSQQLCSAIYYSRAENDTFIYHKMIEEIEYTIKVDSSKNGCSYYGKSKDGTFFVEKQFYKRPTKEGILFFKIPESYYEEIIDRLSKQRYLPLDLFRDSLIRLMEYKLTSVLWDRYEEGRYGFALVNLGYAKSCMAFYFNGAMMGTPLYLSHDFEYVNRSDTSQQSTHFFSKTGRMDYGKSKDGTYFVEKLFYNEQHGLPQGIIMYKIPEEYYDEVLQRLDTLSAIPVDLLWF